jgi:hypothetical protein
MKPKDVTENPTKSGYYWIRIHSDAPWEPARFTFAGGDIGGWWMRIGMNADWRDTQPEWRPIDQIPADLKL